MAIEVMENPFADSSTISIDENQIRNAGASMPDTKVQDLIRAANNEKFDKQEGINERWLLDKEYVSLASQISAELGPFTLDIYGQGQDIISAGVLRMINEGDRTGSFRGQNAAGGSQWDIQQLGTQSFGENNQDRVYSTGTTGNFDIIPDLGGGPTNNTFSPDDDQQNIFILGMYASTNVRVVEKAQLGLDDGEDRQAFDVYSHQLLGTLQAQDLPSLEYVTDDDAMDLNGSATSDSTTDVFPFGVDLNAAANLPDLGVQN